MRYVSFLAVELYAALIARKPIIFRCVKAIVEGNAVRVSVNGATNMLMNCAELVDVDRAECAVKADKDRELSAIPDKTKMNADVAAALISGTVAIDKDGTEVDAYVCGEREALRALPSERVEAAIAAAASVGHIEALSELLARWPIGVTDDKFLGYAAWIASYNGQIEALLLLKDCGADVTHLNVCIDSLLLATYT